MQQTLFNTKVILHAIQFRNTGGPLTDILEIVNQLRGLGKESSSEDVVAALLCSLPESYGTLERH